jgi:RNA polymerase sigma-70 factor (ECF subfamily)
MICVDDQAVKPSGSEDVPDEVLIERIQSGDDSAAAELYHRYAARLRVLADRQMSSAIRRTHEADDIVQSAFRSLFRGVNSGTYTAPEGQSLWSLLAVIAIHKVRRKATRNKSVKAVSLDDASEHPSDHDQFEADVSIEQFESSLRESIEGLRPNEQKIVELRVQGFSILDIADHLQNSCRTVERTLQRIREKLAAELGESTDE